MSMSRPSSVAGQSSHSSASTIVPVGPHVSTTDVEGQKLRNRRGYLDVVLDQTGVTDDVLAFPYPGRGTESEPYVVDFLFEDAHRPMSFPVWKKWTITIIQAMATLAVAFVSSGYVGGVSEVIKEFQISTEVAILGISLFVLGFAVGPLLWAPLSELYGRQYVFFITYMLLVVFNGAAAGAPSMAALVVFRFLAGAFGSSVMTNAGGVIADIFEAKERGLAIAIFALAPFLGPALGPIAGGFLGQAAGWRWVEGLMAAFTGILWLLGIFLVPETYAPVLLRRRASALSRKTGHVYVSKLDAGRERKTVGQELRTGLSRPWVLLFHEPIVSLLSVYMAIIFATLYMCFAAFPIVFQQGRGWSPGIGGLAFSGVAVGMVLGVVWNIAFENKRYIRVLQTKGKATPEDRLPTAIVGSFFVPVGLFWFAWTNGPEIHWIVPIIGTGFFGIGMVLVFLSLFNYLVDSYVIFAASVLSANAVLRALLGAAFPLFTPQMYEALGIHWASSIPAFLALACVPFPYLFWRFGEAIRMRCRFAAEAATVLERMQQQQQQQQKQEEAGGNNSSVMAEEARQEAIDVGADEAMEEVERRETLRSELQRRHSESAKERGDHFTN